MEPIEQDLAERKVRLKRLAIELQKLEESYPRRGSRARMGHEEKVQACREQLEVLKFGVNELEEIIAEHRREKRDRELNIRPSPPDLSRRRALSDKERKRVAADYRRKVLAQLRVYGPGFDPRSLEVHVERVTDLEGQPICGFTIAEPRNEPGRDA